MNQRRHAASSDAGPRRNLLHVVKDGHKNSKKSKKSKAKRPGSSWFEEWTGKNAPLDDDGYDAVASMEADEEMEKYIRRLIKAMDFKIIDMGGLHGVVPYHSGTKVTQSFPNLERDLKRGLHKHGKYGPWLETNDEVALLSN